MSEKVKSILANYASDNPGSKAKLYRLLMQGDLGGSGRMIILPVDQGFEHGPDRSFALNPAGYDPRYHAELALEAGLSAFAAPLGMMEMVASDFAGALPLILKLNSSNSWATTKDQALTGSVRDAVRLGCVAVGFTIYPGSDQQFQMIEELRVLSARAKAAGLAVVVWSYPRGGKLDKQAETALDVTAYAAHLAALLGAHIIKVKPPTAHIAQPEAKKAIEDTGVSTDSLRDRVRHVVQSCFSGKRLVVFSGGAAKGLDALFEEVGEICAGGACGSIIGRNSFQRPRPEALDMLKRLKDIYLG